MCLCVCVCVCFCLPACLRVNMYKCVLCVCACFYDVCACFYVHVRNRRKMEGDDIKNAPCRTCHTGRLGNQVDRYNCHPLYCSFHIYIDTCSSSTCRKYLQQGHRLNMQIDRCRNTEHSVNPFTAMLVAPSLGNLPIKVPNLKSLQPFPPFA